MSFSTSLLPLPSVTQLQIGSVTFAQAINSPASHNPLFLSGAGVRGLDMRGTFVIFTVISIYLEANAVPSLSVKWKGKTTKELTESVPFFRDIVTVTLDFGEFEKFIKVMMKRPLTGKEYSEKVAGNCVAIWKSLGIYTKSEANAIQRFLEIFKDQTFPPGASILLALSRLRFLKTGKAVIENKLLAEAVLESLIGKNGVSPATRLSLAERLAQLMKKNMVEEEANVRSLPRV